MRKGLFQFANASLMAISVTACLSAAKINVDRKISSEDEVESGDELRLKVDNLINGSIALSFNQKEDLNSLFNRSEREAAALRGESLKLRSILIKDLLSETYDAREVILLKKMLAQVSKKKLGLTYKTIEKANEIMGREAKNNHELITEMFRQQNVD